MKKNIGTPSYLANMHSKIDKYVFANVSNT